MNFSSKALQPINHNTIWFFFPTQLSQLMFQLMKLITQPDKDFLMSDNSIILTGYIMVRIYLNSPLPGLPCHYFFWLFIVKITVGSYIQPHKVFTLIKENFKNKNKQQFYKSTRFSSAISLY